VKNWRFGPISRCISKTMKDTAIVTMEQGMGSIEWCYNAIPSDIELPLTKINEKLNSLKR